MWRLTGRPPLSSTAEHDLRVGARHRHRLHHRAVPRRLGERRVRPLHLGRRRRGDPPRVGLGEDHLRPLHPGARGQVTVVIEKGWQGKEVHARSHAMTTLRKVYQQGRTIEPVRGRGVLVAAPAHRHDPVARRAAGAPAGRRGDLRPGRRRDDHHDLSADRSDHHTEADMPTTPGGLRYPAAADPPDVPTDMQELAEDVEAKLPAGIACSFVQWPHHRRRHHLRQRHVPRRAVQCGAAGRRDPDRQHPEQPRRRDRHRVHVIRAAVLHQHRRHDREPHGPLDRRAGPRPDQPAQGGADPAGRRHVRLGRVPDRGMWQPGDPAGGPDRLHRRRRRRPGRRRLQLWSVRTALEPTDTPPAAS